MQLVSKAYREQMDQGIRNLSFAEIQYSIINADAGRQAVLADNGHTYFSSLDIKEGSDPRSYATLEPGRWRLDKGLLLLPEDGSFLHTGFTSEAISDGEGVFADPPTITITFSEPQSFYGHTFLFDEATGEYPAEISVNGVSYFPNAVEYGLPIELIDVTTVTISWLRSSKPYRRARLKKLLFGQIVRFRNDQIISLRFRSSVDFLSTVLSEKTLSFTIDNSKQYYNPLNPSTLLRFVEERQPITMRFGYQLKDGTVEWVPEENLILTGTPSTRGMEATFSAGDALSILTGTYYKGLYRPEGITLYDLAVMVLEDAGAESYDLDPRLMEITTKGALPVATYEECLQVIANAAQCILYVDRSGSIKIENALDPIITPYDNGHMFFSDPLAAFNSSVLPEVKYIDFLPDAWTLWNQNLILLPEDGKYRHVGFVSDRICDETGFFSDPPIYGLKYSFPYPIYSIPIVFDAISGEYATDFTVVYYRRGEEVDRLEVTGNTSVTYTIEHSVAKTDDVQIQINKWSHGTRRGIINQIGGGRVNDFMLRLSDVTEEPSVQKQALCKSVTVNCYSHTASTTEDEIYREEVGVEGEEMTLLINHSPAVAITATMTGGTILSEAHYTSQSEIVVSGAGELVLMGKELVTTTTSIVQQLNKKGEEKAALENPLITSMSLAADVTEWIADYFAKRNVLTVSYRGSPELEVYDLIYMESQFDPLFTVRTMELNLDFNGGLSGRVKAVMV